MSFLASPQQELGFSNGSCRFSSPAEICCRADREKKVYTFEPNLSNKERASIHPMCRKMEMITKSSSFGWTCSQHSIAKRESEEKRFDLISSLKSGARVRTPV